MDRLHMGQCRKDTVNFRPLVGAHALRAVSKATGTWKRRAIHTPDRQPHSVSGGTRSACHSPRWAVRPASDGPIFAGFENTQSTEKRVEIPTAKSNRQGLVVARVTISQRNRPRFFHRPKDVSLPCVRSQSRITL